MKGNEEVRLDFVSFFEELRRWVREQYQNEKIEKKKRDQTLISSSIEGRVAIACP